ncbi:MAG: hypothetical protein GY751_20205 [Bacteroidetes bacterium]|jgi:hypothetical protein|nr:hypothetical protein [Bacteroidota bacterium]
MAEEFKVNTYIVAGVIGISAGGLLLVRSVKTFRTVSYWNTIGMTTVGILMVYGGVKAFQMKGSKDTEKATSAIKEDVTKVIAEVGETTEVAAAEFTQNQRERLAKKGHALKDGSFPIRNKSDLKNAIKTWGLAKKSNKAKAKKFIKLRAKQLNATELLPSTW